MRKLSPGILLLGDDKVNTQIYVALSVVHASF